MPAKLEVSPEGGMFKKVYLMFKKATWDKVNFLYEI